MVNGQLEESLRHEIESYLDGRLSVIKQEITSLQSQLNESLTSLLDRQSDVQREDSLATSLQTSAGRRHAALGLAASNPPGQRP